MGDWYQQRNSWNLHIHFSRDVRKCQNYKSKKGCKRNGLWPDNKDFSNQLKNCFVFVQRKWRWIKEIFSSCCNEQWSRSIKICSTCRKNRKAKSLSKRWPRNIWVDVEFDIQNTWDKLWRLNGSWIQRAS